MSQYSFRKICSALRRYGAAGFMVCGAVSVLQRFGWNVKAMWMCDRKLGESDRSTFEAAHCRLADEGWSLRPLRYADFRRLRPLHPDLPDSHLMLQLQRQNFIKETSLSDSLTVRNCWASAA